MPRLVVTVNDNAALSHLRIAIKQLRGVERVSTLRDASVKAKSEHNKLQQELFHRIDSLAQLSDEWDGVDSKAIDNQIIKKLRHALSKATEQQLNGWVLFPESHGYLYFDYTDENDSAGITVMPDRLVYFIQKNGKVQKNDGIAFTARNLISILKRVNG